MSEDEEGSIPLASLRSKLTGDSNDDGQAGSERDSPEEPDPNTEMAAENGDRPEAADRLAEGNEPRDEDEPDTVPLSGLRDEAQRRERQESEESVSDGAFVEEDVDAIDAEEVWADLLMGSESAEGQFRATEQGADTQVISKRICERCQYVRDPPDLACTHEGTTIHELVDVDHVRVSACPMVGPDGETTQPEEAPPER